MADDPLVSVVITTKNRITLLPRAVKSVLEQTGPSLEVIVVDDGSDVPAALDIQDPRLRFVRHEVSQGLTNARNAGFRAARGQFFCMLDDDDWYLPGKLEKQLAFLEANPEIDMVFSRVTVRDAEGKDRYYLPAEHVHSPEINLYAFNVIHPSSVLMRRKVFEQVPFEPRIKKYEDTLFFIRVTFTFKTAYLPLEVSVWMQDGRPDQLTRVFYERNFVNFRIVCEGLADILERFPVARRKYYGRLAFQAARCGRVWECAKAGAKALGLARGTRLAPAA